MMDNFYTNNYAKLQNLCNALDDVFLEADKANDECGGNDMLTDLLCMVSELRYRLEEWDACYEIGVVGSGY